MASESKLERNYQFTKYEETSINDLPDDMLVEIFEHYMQSESIMDLVYVISQVCHRWKILAEDCRLWKVVDQKVPKSLLLRLSERQFLYRTEKIILNTHVISPDEGDIIFKNCPNLKAIDIKYIGDARLVFDRVAKHCPKMEWISIQKVKNGLTIVELLPVLLSCGKTLTYLNLSHNAIEHLGHSLILICFYCPNLKELHLIDIDGVLHFPAKIMATSCPKLEVLRTKHFSFSFDEDFPGFKNLRTFACEFVKFYGRDNWVIMNFLKHSLNLKVLDLRGAFFEFDNFHLIPALNLEAIYTFLSPDVKFNMFAEVILRWKHSLQVIHLSNAYYECFTPYTVNCLTDGNQNFNMREIGFVRMPVSPDAIEAAVKGFPNLRHLSLQTCTYNGKVYSCEYTSNAEIKSKYSSIFSDA